MEANCSLLDKRRVVFVAILSVATFAMFAKWPGVKEERCVSPMVLPMGIPILGL